MMDNFDLQNEEFIRQLELLPSWKHTGKGKPLPNYKCSKCGQEKKEIAFADYSTMVGRQPICWKCLRSDLPRKTNPQIFICGLNDTLECEIIDEIVDSNSFQPVEKDDAPRAERINIEKE